MDRNRLLVPAIGTLAAAVAAAGIVVLVRRSPGSGVGEVVAFGEGRGLSYGSEQFRYEGRVHSVWTEPVVVTEVVPFDAEGETVAVEEVTILDEEADWLLNPEKAWPPLPRELRPGVPMQLVLSIDCVRPMPVVVSLRFTIRVGGDTVERALTVPPGHDMHLAAEGCAKPAP